MGMSAAWVLAAGLWSAVLSAEVGRRVPVEAVAEAVRPPWIVNPFGFHGGRDIPFRTAGNLVKVNGEVVRLEWGRWSGEVVVPLLERRGVMRVEGVTVFRADREGGMSYRMRPFMPVTTDLRSGLRRTNRLLVLVRLPQYELEILELEPGGEAYRAVASYPVCIGRRSRKTPVGSGFVYTKGLVTLRYLEGPRKGEVIRMVRARPDSEELVPLDRSKMKGLYLCLDGDMRHMIHATTEWWRKREAVSSGCCRLSIPDMEEVYARVSVGTPVRTVYETVEVSGGRLRIWPDVYGLDGDRADLVVRKLEEAGVPRRMVDEGKVGRLVSAVGVVDVPVAALLRRQTVAAGAQASTEERR